MNERRGLTATAAGFAVVALVVSASGLMDRFELPLRDRLMRAGESGSAASVAVVEIDDRSLASLGPWPWPRSRIGALVDAARAEGAVAVAIDLLLVEPLEGDDQLATALAAGDTMLLAGVGTEGAPLLPPARLSGSCELVHGVLELDGDGVLRRIATTKQTESASYTAMSAAAATRVRRDLAIPIGREVVPGLSVRPDDVPRVSAAELLSPKRGRRLEDRVAFVGVTATGLGDRVITPVTKRGRLDPGVVVHATIAESLIRNDVVSVAPPWVAALLAPLFVLAAWRTGHMGGFAHVAGVVGVITVPVVAGLAVFALIDIALPMVLLTTTAVAAVLLVEARALVLVDESVGRAAYALGDELPIDGSPAERVRHLEELAGAIARERSRASESQRVVAHELRTPLTSIRGLAQLLAAYDLTEDERRRVAAMVAEESTRLHEMVEGLLDLERLALRERGVDLQSFDVARILAKRSDLARAVGTHEIVLDCREALPIRGDEALLERLLENLVGNAMKFSPEGKKVTLRGVKSDGEVVIEVRDEGPGIPPEERESVLRRFGRGRATAGQPGLGLGLAFVAEIVRWHGGRVEVDDGARGGACLRVRLPLATAGTTKESGE